MKKFLTALSFVIAGSALAADEGFLPGRIESRTAARTILAKCAVRDAVKADECIGFQFFYSESGKEADAKPISKQVFTEASLKDLKRKPVLFNFFDAFFPERDQRSFTVGVVQFLNDYEDSWGESVSARVAYASGRGLLYGTMVPVAAGMDVAGTVVAAPVTLVQVVLKSGSNAKIRKLIRAMKSGRKINMNIESVYRLRDML